MRNGNQLLFSEISWGHCSPDKRSRVTGAAILPLHSCRKNILAHTQAVAVNDVESEVDLILAWASIFALPSDISDWTICPGHRSSLGIGWRRGSEWCRVLAELSKHAKGRKADRGINKALSHTILQLTGIFVPVGSGKST